MDIMTLINSILDGEYDEDFSDIAEAIKERKTVLRAQTFARLRVGDTVRISGARPQYLNGAEAEVVEKRTTKVTILFPLDMGNHDPYRKFAGRRWIFPTNVLEKIDG